MKVRANGIVFYFGVEVRLTYYIQGSSSVATINLNVLYSEVAAFRL